MSVTVPTGSLELNTRNFRWKQAVRSGEHASDRGYGWLGVVQQANHGYAHLIQTLYVLPSAFNGEAIMSSNDDEDFVSAGRCWVYIGAGFSTVRLRAIVEDCKVRLNVGSDTNSAEHLEGKGMVTVDLALSNTSGSFQHIELAIAAGESATAYVYGAHVEAVALVSADFPQPS
jgi:hypothetical protein